MNLKINRQTFAPHRLIIGLVSLVVVEMLASTLFSVGFVGVVYLANVVEGVHVPQEYVFSFLGETVSHANRTVLLTHWTEISWWVWPAGILVAYAISALVVGLVVRRWFSMEA